MTQSQSPITRTTHTLPFDKLSPRDFERLCLWLIEREGYERAEHLGIAYPDSIIRVMKSRWGSSSPLGKITFNIKLIQVPKAYIDYVIFHELCHLKEPNHGQSYYELLDRVMPDWRDRREKLNAFEFG